MVKVDYEDTWQSHVHGKAEYRNRCRIYLFNSLALLKSRVQLAHPKIMDAFRVVVTSEEGNLYLFYRISDDIGKPFHDLLCALNENKELVHHRPYDMYTHMIVVRPDINYDAFLEGRYSEIYTPIQIKTCFIKDTVARRVLLKTAHEEFAKFLKTEFGTNVEVNPKQECDIPCSYKQEIYNV